MLQPYGTRRACCACMGSGGTQGSLVIPQQQLDVELEQSCIRCGGRNRLRTAEDTSLHHLTHTTASVLGS